MRLFGRSTDRFVSRPQLARGSLTVEAVLLTPLLIYLMIGLIYLDFWLYDQVTAEALCCQAAWVLECEEEEEAEVTEHLNQLLSGNLLADKMVAASCSRNMIWSQADCTLVSQIPFAGVRSLLGGTAGYSREHRSIVSNLADVTMFRKLSQ